MLGSKDHRRAGAGWLVTRWSPRGPGIGAMIEVIPLTRIARRPRWVTVALASVLAVAVGLLGAAPASAVTTTYAYDTAVYVYDVPARLSSPDTAPKDARGSPPRPEAGSWVSLASVRDDVVAANTGRADFIASADGVVVPTSRSRLVAGFEEAGLPSTPTTSAGTQYTLPNGSLVRVMEPSGQAGLRASFTNADGGPINPFTGKPVQPPPGLSKPERLDYIRSRTHIELGP